MWKSDRKFKLLQWKNGSDQIEVFTAKSIANSSFAWRWVKFESGCFGALLDGAVRVARSITRERTRAEALAEAAAQTLAMPRGDSGAGGCTGARIRWRSGRWASGGRLGQRAWTLIQRVPATVQVACALNPLGVELAVRLVRVAHMFKVVVLFAIVRLRVSAALEHVSAFSDVMSDSHLYSDKN